MQTKKISVILIAVAFMLVVLFSCVGLFSVKKIQINFAVSDQTDSASIQSTLDGFLGDNLLFMKTEEIEKALKGYHYMEVVSVKKQYPNVIIVSLKERREIYYVKYGEVYYVTTEDGFVLKSVAAAEFSGNTSRDKILLELVNINVTSATIGSYLKTDNDQIMTTVFEMAKSVNLTDCIKTISVEKKYDELVGTEYIGVYDATFNTYSGVSMMIERVTDQGVEKTENAFYVYDTVLTDYQKAGGAIESYLMNDGNFRVTYEQKEVWTSNQ